LGGLGLLLLVHTTRTALPEPPKPRGRSRFRDDYEALAPPLAELARTEREVALATGTAFDVHYRLRPLLREVAAHRLATRRGIDLDAGGEQVRALLGWVGWEICRPSRERPDDHFAPAPRLAQVRDAREAIERW